MEDQHIPESIVTIIGSGLSTIKAYRLHAAFSLEFVAARCSVSVERLIRIEAGANATAEEIRCIAKVLGVSIEALGFPVYRSRRDGMVA